MAEAIYLLCAVTSLVTALLLPLLARERRPALRVLRLRLLGTGGVVGAARADQSSGRDAPLCLRYPPGRVRADDRGDDRQESGRLTYGRVRRHEEQILRALRDLRDLRL